MIPARSILPAFGLGLGLAALGLLLDGETHPGGPGRVPPDDFRSGRFVEPKPVPGGRVVIHVPTRLDHLNTVLQSSAQARRILEEIHARLVERDWETWELEPSLAHEIEVDDIVVLAGGWGEGTENILIGDVTRRGDEVIIVTDSSEERIPASAAQRFEPGAAITFHLRDDVLWHDGHPFDASDVIFSIETYLDPTVRSDHARYRFERLHHFEAVDEHTVRVFFEKSFFLALETFEDDFTILPSHVFDLSDFDNRDFDPDATPERRGSYINAHRANSRWIGLGPYKVVEMTDQHVDAVRFDDYFDAEQAGFVDAIRWRIVSDDGAARQALLAGEFDFFGRLRSRDFLGEFCSQEDFVERFEKGVYYTPQMNYVAWNMRRPLFEDVRVRTALAHAFDWDRFIATIGNGMGKRVTAQWYCFSPNYDEDVEPIPFDLERAEALLLDAGWYDRDGDGRIDKNGRPFEFEYLYANVDAVARLVGEGLQENLEKLGIGMELVARDFATRQSLVRKREFDAAAMAWIFGPELDPSGYWHSSQAAREGTSNQPGYADPESDRLIAAIRREADPELRREHYHALQRRIHDAQPYMFGCLFPTKFAVSKRVRNVQRFYLDPGYSIRRWYVEAEPETDE